MRLSKRTFRNLRLGESKTSLSFPFGAWLLCVITIESGSSSFSFLFSKPSHVQGWKQLFPICLSDKSIKMNECDNTRRKSNSNLAFTGSQKLSFARESAHIHKEAQFQSKHWTDFEILKHFLIAHRATNAIDMNVNSCRLGSLQYFLSSSAASTIIKDASRRTICGMQFSRKIYRPRNGSHRRLILRSLDFSA